MEFDLTKTIQVLERTPTVLEDLLSGLPDDWIMNNEGPETWSPYDIMGHLIHGEHTDWMGRLTVILNKDDKHFIPFDRTAMFKESEGKNLQQLIREFKELRNDNLQRLKSLHLTDNDLDKKGIHPTFGEVTLRQLLSTWTVHDLTHIAQITRVMAKQYKEAIGPWVEFFRVLQ